MCSVKKVIWFFSLQVYKWAEIDTLFEILSKYKFKKRVFYKKMLNKSLNKFFVIIPVSEVHQVLI